MMAVGVASPRAQGQAITSTETKLIKARLKFPSAERKYQTAKVIKAIRNTAGTKTETTLSARR